LNTLNYTFIKETPPKWSQTLLEVVTISDSCRKRKEARNRGLVDLMCSFDQV